MFTNDRGYYLNKVQRQVRDGEKTQDSFPQAHLN